MKKAIIFGATGAVGQCLLMRLIASEQYQQVIAVVRKQVSIAASKKLVIIVEQNIQPSSFSFSGKHADVFCTLGTTINNAGSKAAFQRVDLDLVVSLASWAKSQSAKSFSVISSLGANAHSKNFYLATKGKMERELQSLELNLLAIYRPSLMYGAKRPQFRLAELVGLIAIYPLGLLPFKITQRYAPIRVEVVAQAMLSHAIKAQSGVFIFESDAIRKMK